MDGSFLLQLLLAVGSLLVPDGEEEGRSSSREPRFVAVPPGAPVTVGLIFGVPISFLVPVVRKRLNDFSQIGKEGDVPLPPEGGEETESGREGKAQSLNENEALYDFDDPVHVKELNKLDSYFGFMELESDVCRRRILCEFSADFDEFFPVSDIFLRMLRPKDTIGEDLNNRFWRYLQASKTGFNGGFTKCRSSFKNCPFGARDILELRVLKVIQLLSRWLNLDFVDRE